MTGSAAAGKPATGAALVARSAPAEVGGIDPVPTVGRVVTALTQPEKCTAAECGLLRGARDIHGRIERVDEPAVFLQHLVNY